MIVKPFRTCYRFIVRPSRRGVKVAIINDGRVLLVRPTYDHKLWTLPGGKVERYESYEEAGRREVFEETGLRVDALTLVREYETYKNYVRNVNKAFATTSSSTETKVDGLEIKEAKWFSLDQLPPDRVPRVDETLEVYRKTQR